jgi:hypothetical protein
MERGKEVTYLVLITTFWMTVISAGGSIQREKSFGIVVK